MASTDVTLKVSPSEFRTIGVALRVMKDMAHFADTKDESRMVSTVGVAEVLKDFGAGNPPTAWAAASHLLDTLECR